MIAFKQDTELEVVIRFDEANDTIAEQSTEVFKAGELVDAEIVNEDKSAEFVDIQYGDGTVSLNVQRASFDVIGENA